jgi:hypothetical protein
MSDKNKNAEPPPKESAKIAEFLWNLILLCVGSFAVKTVWNITIKRMFPSIPYMYFLDGVGILVMVYIIARAASMGFMTETIRMFAVVLKEASEALEELSESLGLNKIKVNVRKNNEQRNDNDSGLN